TAGSCQLAWTITTDAFTRRKTLPTSSAAAGHGVVTGARASMIHDRAMATFLRRARQAACAWPSPDYRAYRHPTPSFHRRGLGARAGVGAWAHALAPRADNRTDLSDDARSDRHHAGTARYAGRALLDRRAGGGARSSLSPGQSTWLQRAEADRSGRGLLR